MKKCTERLLCIFMVTILILSCGMVSFVMAEEEKSDSHIDENSAQSVTPNTNKLISYRDYKNQISDVCNSSKEFRCSASDYSSYDGFAANVVSINDEKNVVQMDSAGSKLTFNINVSQTSLYQMGLRYAAMDSANGNLIMAMNIDGKVLFDKMNSLEFPVLWKNKTKNPRIDGLGNEFAAEQIVDASFTEQYAYDNTGIEKYPYNYYLSAGSHTVTLMLVEGKMYLSQVIFAAPEKPIPYSQYSSDFGKEKDSNVKPIVVEGEKFANKTSALVVPNSDNQSVSVTPMSIKNKKLNYIGGSNWTSANDTITWKIHVDKSGYYKLGFHYRQNYVVNGIAYRSLRIDGKIPFEEASAIPFTYCYNWKLSSFEHKDGKPYEFYLSEGDHSLSMSVTLGDLAEVYGELQKSLEVIGNLYLDMIMITGESVDNQRSYELFRQIPGMSDTLENEYKHLEKIRDDFVNITGKKSSNQISCVINMMRIMKQMNENPYLAHQYISSYSSSYDSLSAVMLDMVKMATDIDKIIIQSPDEKLTLQNDSLFNQFIFSTRRFFMSFVRDYDSMGGKSDNSKGKPIKLWVTWGRDQAQILQSLIRTDFTTTTGIQVDLKLTNTSTIQAIASGNVPDCTLQMARSEPVNLAMRGALYDLTAFEDYKQVLERFQNDAEKPYRYLNGLYALPDTQGFMMLFYRTDVFDKFELKSPETWDQFKEVSAVLMRHNLNVYMPYTQISDLSIVNTGVGGLSLFPTMAMQQGLSLYTDDQKATTLTNPNILSVFTELTDYYTKLSVPVTADFYNRFRNGSMPMGISSYTMYSTLKVAAPEIDGRWTMASIPGTLGSDNKISHVEAGSGSGSVIFKNASNPKGAWEFLKWWTSSKTQADFSQGVESILGVAGRIMTANVEALGMMNWSNGAKDALYKQWKEVKEIPEVPGGYYTARVVDQAFWNTVNGTETPKDSLQKWGAIADDEINRKREEYGL